MHQRFWYSWTIFLNEGQMNRTVHPLEGWIRWGFQFDLMSILKWIWVVWFFDMGFQVVVQQSDSIWKVEWTYPFMKLIQSSGFIQSGSQMEVLFDMGRGQVTDWSISTTWYIHLHSIYITWWSNFTEDLERKKIKVSQTNKRSKLGFLIRVGIEHDAPLQTTTPSFYE